MTVSEIIDRLTALGFRVTERNDGTKLCVNPTSGSSFGLPADGAEIIDSPRLQRMLEKLEISYAELMA